MTRRSCLTGPVPVVGALLQCLYKLSRVANMFQFLKHYQMLITGLVKFVQKLRAAQVKVYKNYENKLQGVVAAFF